MGFVMSAEIEKRRTFAIVSHPDAGKTTITEKFLWYGNVIREAGHVRAKAKAFSCYVSQRERPYADEGFFLSLARCRGVQIGRDYAEAFETVRWIF